MINKIKSFLYCLVRILCNITNSNEIHGRRNSNIILFRLDIIFLLFLRHIDIFFSPLFLASHFYVFSPISGSYLEK